MQYARPYPQKPGLGAFLDQTHPWANGLQGFYALNENSGSRINDQMGRLNLTTSGYGATNPWTSGSQTALYSSTGCASATLPAALQLGTTGTLAIALRFTGQIGSNVTPIAGLNYDNAHSSPYMGFGFIGNFPHTVYLAWNSAGAFKSSASYTFTVGADLVLLGTGTAASKSFYVNGSLLTTTAGPFSAPTYATASTLSIGYNVAGYQSTIAVYWMAVWNTALPAATCTAITSNVNAIWQLFPFGPSRWACWQPAPGYPAYYPGSASLRCRRPATTGPLFTTIYG
jgi:hypothetical protein